MTDLAATRTELRTLLEKAPDGPPWIRLWESLDVHGIRGDGVLTRQRNIDLAVAAVNALPALLADTPSVEPALEGHYPGCSGREGECACAVCPGLRPSVEPPVGRKPTARRRHAQRLFDAARPSVEPPIDADILGMALDLVDEEDMRVGVVGRGRKVDRVVAEYVRLLPTQASDSPEKT